MALHTVFHFTFRCILFCLISITISFPNHDTFLWSFFALIVSPFFNAPDQKCDCGPSGCVNGSHESEKEKRDLYELELEAGDGGDMRFASLLSELRWEGSGTGEEDAKESLDGSVDGGTEDHDLVAEAAPPSSHLLALESECRHPHERLKGSTRVATHDLVIPSCPRPNHPQDQPTAVIDDTVQSGMPPLLPHLWPPFPSQIFNLAGQPPDGATNCLTAASPSFGNPQQKPTPPIDNAVPPATFPLFSRLPLSVRARIFAFASPPARTRFIELYDYDEFTNTTKVRYYPPLPSLMHACRLARGVCMRLWGGDVVHFLPPDYSYLTGDVDERSEDQDEEEYEEDEGTPFLFGFYANLNIDIIWLSSRFGPRLQRRPPPLGNCYKDPLSSSRPQSQRQTSSSNTPIPKNGYTYAPTTESCRLHTLNDLLPTCDLSQITHLALSFSAHERFDRASDFADAFRWLETCHTVYLLVLDDGYSPRSARYALKVGKPAVGALSGRMRRLLVREEEVWREWEDEVEAPAAVAEAEGSEAQGVEWGEWVGVREERRRERRERRYVEVGEVRLDY